MDRTKYRQRLSDELHIRQRDRNHQRITGSAAAADTFDVIERELSLSGVELDDDERRTLLWLCGGEIGSLATIVALILDRGR